MRADPSGRRPASLPTAPGSTVARIFPGIVVPPPLPASRESRPDALASAISARSRTRASLRVPSAPSNEGDSAPLPERGRRRLCPIIRPDFQLRPARQVRGGRQGPYAAGQRHEGQSARQRAWGKPKGETRSSALWGKPGRGFVILALVAALAAPVAATAGESGRWVQAARALVPASLMDDAQAHPNKVFSVIVQGSRGTKSSAVAGEVGNSISAKPGKAKGVKKSFTSVNGVSAELTGAQIVDLAKRPGILAITPDGRIRLSAQYTNGQTWVDSAGVSDFYTGQACVTERPRDRDRGQRRRGRSHGLRRPGRQAGHNDEPAPELARRRSWSRHLRGGDRSGLQERLCRCGAGRRSSRSTSWTTTAWR